MIIAAVVGLIGVLLVAKTRSRCLNALSVIGLGACFLSAVAFVTVRALTSTGPPERIVFYLYFWHAHFIYSNVLALAYLHTQRVALLITAGLLANISQLFMSHAIV